MINNYINKLKLKIRLLPTDLKCLVWFSALLFLPCALSIIFARKQIFEEIIPYTGWSPGFLYFLLAFIILSVPKNQTKNEESNIVNILRIRYKIILLFGIYLIFGIYDWFDSAPEWYISTNPYLRYDPLRPIYSIFLPIIWILIIGWPLIKNRKKLKFLV
jgi:hypothetical protein